MSINFINKSNNHTTVKIAIINGSPRKKNSHDVVLHVINKFTDINFDVINLSEEKIGFCVDCAKCFDGKCVINDDCNKVAEKLVDAQGLLFVSPTYFGGMTAQLKALIDRTRPLRRNGFMLKDKIGSVIALGGSRNGGQELVCQQIHAFMHIQGMVIVGDNNHFGGIVKSPFSDDDVGRGTVDATVEKLIATIDKLHN